MNEKQKPAHKKSSMNIMLIALASLLLVTLHDLPVSAQISITNKTKQKKQWLKLATLL
jgi:hypothetical protein